MTETVLENSTSGVILLDYAWGSRLREARVAQGLTLDDVINELHLELSMLKALEQEDVTRLPGASFVKGYLRNYARFLELPSDDIVAAYAAVADDSPCLQKVLGVKQLSSQDKIPRIATWVVVAVLALSIIWWWSSIILSKGNDSFKDLLDVETEITPLTRQSSVQADVLVDGESVTVAPLMLPDEGRTIEVNPTEKETKVAELAPVIDLSDELVEQSPVVEPAPATPPVVKLEIDYTGLPSSKLTLSFEQDSWIEITDVTGKRLFFDLGLEGQVRKLVGIGPFKVLFGNAPGVRLSIDGEAFDHVPYQRNGGVARFTLK